MTHLCIDAGNTNIVFAVAEGETIKQNFRITTQGPRTADEYAAWLLPLMQLEGLTRADIKAVIISNVVPDTQFHLNQLCKKYFNLEPLIIGDKNLPHDLEIKIDAPEELGADRIVNSVAVKKRYKLPVIVVDFGTATTFDVIDAKGAFVGGVIAPGVNLSLQALSQAAAKLPRIAIAKPPAVIGTRTVPAMQSGIFWGYVGLIEGIAARIQQQLGQNATLLATGGLASLFAGAVKNMEKVDSNLTILGINDIYLNYLKHQRKVA
ncbi:MAG: type III pantothenate kinase [Dongiaceae bacterium]